MRSCSGRRATAASARSASTGSPTVGCCSLSGATRSVVRQEPDGTLVTHADLSGAFDVQQWNEIAVDGRGNAYLNNIAFDFPGGEFRPGLAAAGHP